MRKFLVKENLSYLGYLMSDTFFTFLPKIEYIMKEYITQTSKQKLQGELCENEPLAPYTTWRVGGPAKHLYKPASIEDLSFFLSVIPSSENVVFLGAGSNMLVCDEGFSGTVIITNHLLKNVSQCDENKIYVEAGITLLELAYFGAGLNLCGLDRIAGIPGTIGGALAMNAGAYSSETWDFVDEVKVINRAGEIIVRKPSDYKIGYRSVNVADGEWFVACVFNLTPGNKETYLEAIKQMLAKRASKHPLEFSNAGSVFRNPPGDYSARLIEASHLKGFRIGGASVSTKHVNFIVNDKNATAADIEALIKHVVAVIQQDHGIRLLREVRILTKEGIRIDHGE